MSATPRLYVANDLAPGDTIALAEEQSHYLARVMRLGTGDPVRLFNGRDGEFDAAIAAAGKREVTLKLGSRTREPAAPPDLWLLFAPLKKANTDLVVEKAVELGVAEIYPVLTERTGAENVRTDRLKRIAIEAAEQTERLDVPPVREAADLSALLAGWPKDRRLFFADEAGDEGGKPWGGSAGRAGPMPRVDGPAAILIGPEGGFTPAERSRLRGFSFVTPIGLGPRILRAETAAISALTLWQALNGDWAD